MSEQESTQAYVPILSRLRPADGAVKSKRRKGRGPGSGLGKTAGKGQKGQKARHPGAFSKLAFEGGQLPLQRRLPKVGFWNPFTRHLATVNLSDLAVFEKGAVVDANALREKRLVRGRFDGIKVLGNGELAHAMTIRAHGFSKSALDKIAKVGGKAEVIALAPRAE